MLQVKLNTDNEMFAAEKWKEAANILRGLADELDLLSDDHKGVINLFDDNGNHIGFSLLKQ